MDRKTELLIAVCELLNRQNKTTATLNMLDVIIEYEGVECDGSSLLDEIKDCLEEDGIDVGSL